MIPSVGDPITFWSEVLQQTDAEGKQKFLNVANWALGLFSLPFSNASVERLFSVMNSTHTKLRIRLHAQTVQAVLQIRYGLKRRGETGTTFKPSDEMLSHFYDKAAGSLDEVDDDIPEIATDIDLAYAQLLSVCTVSIAW